MTASAVADLPEPDSPTSATVSPSAMSKEMRSTASVSRALWRYVTDKLSTSSSLVIRCPSPERLARIERVAHGFADEDQQRQHDGDGEESRKAEPGRLDIGLALLEQLAERGRARRQTEAEEVERGQRHHRARQNERQERHGGHHGVRQEMAEHDHRIRHAERARGLDVLEIAAAQELGTYQPDQ